MSITVPVQLSVSPEAQFASSAQARRQQIADEPEVWSNENFPFAALREHKIRGVPVLACRISYVGEQGRELHFQ